MKGREGFTLLELIAALSISALIGVWATGFLGSQLVSFRKYIQLSQAESLGDRTAFKLTSKLEQAVSFRRDPERGDILYYLEGETWKSLELEDRDQLPSDGYEVKLDFSDTEPEMAVAEITISYKGKEIHSRRIELPALYGAGE